MKSKIIVVVFGICTLLGSFMVNAEERPMGFCQIFGNGDYLQGNARYRFTDGQNPAVDEKQRCRSAQVSW